MMDLDCFPVAITNLLKWAGRRISYRNQRFIIYDLVNFDPHNGTAFFDCDSALKRDFPELILSQGPVTITSFKDHIRTDGSIVFTYRKDSGRFHTVFVIGTTKKGFLVVGNVKKSTISTISFEKMKVYIRRRNATYFFKKKHLHTLPENDIL